MFKRDLKRAYRQIPVDVVDVPLLGYSFEDKLYFYLFLSMGLRSVAYICQRVTNAIRYMCQMMKIAVLNYLDDFAGADTPELASKSFEELGELLTPRGIEVKGESMCPKHKNGFIGVLFDTEDMILSVSPEREFRKFLSWLMYGCRSRLPPYRNYSLW